MVGIFQVRSAIDSDVIPDAAVFVYDTIADITAVPDSDGGQSMFLVVPDFFDGFIIIDPHQVAADDGCSNSYPRADSDYTAFYTRCINDATFCNDRFFQRRAADLCRWQHACARIYRVVVVE